VKSPSVLAQCTSVLCRSAHYILISPNNEKAKIHITYSTIMIFPCLSGLDIETNLTKVSFRQIGSNGSCISRFTVFVLTKIYTEISFEPGHY